MFREALQYLALAYFTRDHGVGSRFFFFLRRRLGVVVLLPYGWEEPSTGVLVSAYGA